MKSCGPISMLALERRLERDAERCAVRRRRRTLRLSRVIFATKTAAIAFINGRWSGDTSRRNPWVGRLVHTHGIC